MREKKKKEVRKEGIKTKEEIGKISENKRAGCRITKRIRKMKEVEIKEKREKRKTQNTLIPFLFH